MDSLINIFYFGDVGEYDEYNPDYIMSMPHTGEILKLIGKSKPYSLSYRDMAALLNISVSNVENVINNLLKIKAIKDYVSHYL